MNTGSTERKRPLWGVISVLAVPVGALMVFVVGKLLITLGGAPADTAGWGYVLLAVICVPGSMLLAVVAALVSWVRGEKYPWLPLLGLLLAVLPLILLITGNRN